jgi:hypothetical protein
MFKIPTQNTELDEELKKAGITFSQLRHLTAQIYSFSYFAKDPKMRPIKFFNDNMDQIKEQFLLFYHMLDADSIIKGCEMFKLKPLDLPRLTEKQRDEITLELL